MNTREEKASDAAKTAPKNPSYSQAGTIGDASLSGLRDQIKNIMIPMLIKIFQLKLELSHSISLPSRLQNLPRTSPDATLEELKKLDEDLKLLILWCQSCHNQISKALSLAEEEQKETLAATSKEADPIVTKSHAVAALSMRYKTSPEEQAVAESSLLPSSEQLDPALAPLSWWRKLLRRRA